MKSFVENRCIVCYLIFCCGDCRWKHEKNTHGLQYNCPICRGLKYLCKPEELTQVFLQHLTEHLPLNCNKCGETFYTMEDLSNIDKCSSISELVNNTNNIPEEVDKKFESIYEATEPNTEVKVINNKTAVITPIVRKTHLVDYESSESESEEVPMSDVMKTPHPMARKVPKMRQRAATPHVKKLLELMKQKTLEEIEEIEKNSEDNLDSKTTPKNAIVSETPKDMTTPTSHLPHLLKLAQAATTSTPTHPITGGWSMFPEQGADSPLSEIENVESPAQSVNNEASKTSETLPPKLKSIISTNSRRLTSQDSSEKHVTFQDSNDGSMKKKVKFAEDTVFGKDLMVKRVFRKPKRMLTPGPQKPKFCYNPRFQALINRFENQGLTVARTPKIARAREQPQENTPASTESNNLPARAINFKEDSPIVDNISKETNDSSYKTCIASPDVNNALNTLTANIAGSLQTCLHSALKTSEEDTEIQFKFVITKKRVQRFVAEEVVEEEKIENIEKNLGFNKENLWSSVAKAVKNVFWNDQASPFAPTTPHRSIDSNSSSGSKRKLDEISDYLLSPLNHKRYKYEGKIKGRPPLRSRCGVSGLRSSRSAEQHNLLKDMADEGLNLSF